MVQWPAMLFIIVCILLSGRGCEFVLCPQRPPVLWQRLEMLKRQYP